MTMRLVGVHGQLHRPALAVIGTWDPLLPQHLALFDTLRWSARRQELAAVAVVLDPSPALFLNGEANWPVYNDLLTRVWLMLDAGLDAVAHIGFEEADLDGEAEQFIDVVFPHIHLKQVWLGSAQSLGRGPKGNRKAVETILSRRGIELRVLDATADAAGSAEVRSLLGAGCIEAAIRLAGRPPFRSRTSAGLYGMAVRPGVYRVQGFETPNRKLKAAPHEITMLHDSTGLSMFKWPKNCDCEYLAFAKGPGDEV
jgi:FAD synthase